MKTQKAQRKPARFLRAWRLLRAFV